MIASLLSPAQRALFVQLAPEAAPEREAQRAQACLAAVTWQERAFLREMDAHLRRLEPMLERMSSCSHPTGARLATTVPEHRS